MLESYGHFHSFRQIRFDSTAIGLLKKFRGNARKGKTHEEAFEESQCEVIQQPAKKRRRLMRRNAEESQDDATVDEGDATAIG